jgi:hypothetical protein
VMRDRSFPGATAELTPTHISRGIAPFAPAGELAPDMSGNPSGIAHVPTPQPRSLT